jgi:hypothetical protein
MAHGVHPILPFDITECTYLALEQPFGMTTEALVALRAHQLMKRPKDIEDMRERVTQSRERFLEQFERRYEGRIVDFDFQPGSLVLIRNSRVEESLNRKTKPRYFCLVVVVRKTPGTSYVVAELDGSTAQLRVADFRLIPYFSRSKTKVLLPLSVSEEEDGSIEDPADVHFFSMLRAEDWEYSYVSVPSSNDSSDSDLS